MLLPWSAMIAMLTPEALQLGLSPAEPADLGHSHNDYEHARPLADALAARFHSVEADVWWRDGDVVVSHEGVFDKGRLEDLYLRPLAGRVARYGTVLGDGQPFLLWIELKEDSPELNRALYAALERYPMLTRFTDAQVESEPVTVVLTGNEAAKRRFVDGHAERPACRDSNLFDPKDPPADLRWTWYALPWSKIVRNGGKASPAASDVERLHEVVARAHALGRRVRLYRVPARPAAWEAALESGADLVSVDDLAAFRAFLTPSRQAVAWHWGRYRGPR